MQRFLGCLVILIKLKYNLFDTRRDVSFPVFSISGIVVEANILMVDSALVLFYEYSSVAVLRIAAYIRNFMIIVNGLSYIRSFVFLKLTILDVSISVLLVIQFPPSESIFECATCFGALKAGSAPGQFSFS